jgi:hypothetical protein
MAAGSPPNVLRSTEDLHKRYDAISDPFPRQCLLERKLEAINRLDDIDTRKTTMNKFLSFLVAVLAVTKASAFMSQPVFGQQRVMTNLVAVMFVEFRTNIGNT